MQINVELIIWKPVCWERIAAPLRRVLRTHCFGGTGAVGEALSHLGTTLALAPHV